MIQKAELITMYPASEYNYTECLPTGIFFMKSKVSMRGGKGLFSIPGSKTWKSIKRSARKTSAFVTRDRESYNRVNDEQREEKIKKKQENDEKEEEKMLEEMNNYYTPIGSIIISIIRLDKNTQRRLQSIYMKQQNRFSDLKAQPIDILNAMMTHKTLIIPVKRQIENLNAWFGKGRSAIAYDKANNEYVSLLLKNQTTFERFYKKSNQIKKKKFSKNVLENQFLWVFDPEQQPPTEDLRSSFYSITGFSDGNENTFDNIIKRSNDNKLKEQEKKEDEVFEDDDDGDEDGAGEGMGGGGTMVNLKHRLFNKKKTRKRYEENDRKRNIRKDERKAKKLKKKDRDVKVYQDELDKEEKNLSKDYNGISIIQGNTNVGPIYYFDFKEHVKNIMDIGDEYLEIDSEETLNQFHYGRFYSENNNVKNIRFYFTLLLKYYCEQYILFKNPDFKCHSCPLKQKLMECNKCKHSFYRLNLYINKNKINQLKLIKELNNKGINCNVGSCPEIYREKIFRKLKHNPKKRFLNSKLLGETSLVFVINPYKKREKHKSDIIHVKNILNKYL